MAGSRAPWRALLVLLFLVATLLAVNGFEVFDLGVDVADDTFIAKVREIGANVLGMSALLTTTMPAQRRVIQALEEAGIRNEVKVIVGGAPVTPSWTDEIGADGYAESAVTVIEETEAALKRFHEGNKWTR